MDEAGQPKTLAEAKRMIARLREQNHAHAAKRDQQMRLLQRTVDRTRSDFEWARKMAANETWWKHTSHANKMVITDAVGKARKINVELLARAMGIAIWGYAADDPAADAAGEDLAPKVAAEYEKLLDEAQDL